MAIEPDPEPGEEFVEPVCTGCGRTMVSVSHWKRASEAERAELLDEGYIRRRRGTLCWDCAPVANNQVRSRLTPEQLAQHRGQPGYTVRRYLECRAEGMITNTEIASHLGISSNGLRKALRTARANGQEIPA